MAKILSARVIKNKTKPKILVINVFLTIKIIIKGTINIREKERKFGKNSYYGQK